MTYQTTIAREASLGGIGLHTGTPCRVTFRPAPAGSGLTFVRTDLPGRPSIPAHISRVAQVDRGTTLANGPARVHTVEHLLAAATTLGIDNLLIELDGHEPPVGDGSALPYCELLSSAGLVELPAERSWLVIREPLHVSDPGAEFLVLPWDGLKITFTIEFDHPLIGTQVASFSITPETFLRELAPARTFGFLHELEALREAGLIKGGSLENAIVLAEERLLNPEPLRFPDEFVRHKMVDLLGDLALLGQPLKAHVLSVRSGHRSNVNLVRRLVAMESPASPPLPPGTSMDINRILEFMPHRYPFLLVDRILQVDGQRVVGIKNVTINEPFFAGHFPGHPIMPGVLIVEAMAQVGGILLLSVIPQPQSKVVYFMAMDHVRFRRPVLPGDQLRLEVEMLSLKTRTFRIRGQAFVEGNRVAEAELMGRVVEK